MKNITYIITFVIFFTITISFGQSRILGTVTDENYPLPGANVQVVGATKGVNTDFDGNFILNNLEEGTIKLKISFIGFVTKTIELNIKQNETKNIGTILLEASLQQLNEVTIQATPRRNSEARALNMQKKAASIMSVIAADGIGKLPDRNAAETVQRMQGVSIERDQGEGRFVSVRGLPPFWTATTINGSRIPTAEEETTSRATAFDFFPSELIAYVQVAKAFTPDMEADGIGGGVNFITQTAPAKKILNVTVGGGYNQKSGNPIYNTSLTIGNKSKNGKFGYIINGSYWHRNWGTDNFEARRKEDEGVFRMELRDYNGVRKTTGLNAAMEYNFTPMHKMYFRGVYGTLSDTEEHYKHRVRFDKYNRTTQTARVELQNIHDQLITEMYGAELGGKHLTNKGKLTWNMATYRNEFSYGNIPNAANNSYYVVKFKQDGVGIKPKYIEIRNNASGNPIGPRTYWKADGGILDYNNTDSLFGFFSNPNFTTEASKMQLADVELYNVSVLERDNIVSSLDYEHKVNDALKIKIGTKFRDKDRIATFQDIFYEWNGSIPAPNMAAFQQYLIAQPGKNEYLQEIGSTIQNSFGSVLSVQGMLKFWEENQKNLEAQAYSQGLQYNSGLGRNFNVDETHLSFYGMTTFKASEKWTFLGGLRATKTETEVNGYVLENNVLKKVNNQNNYWAILPMLHVKYTPTTNVNLRFATTRSFSRPNFGDISPSGTFIQVDNEFKGGNPNLNPTFSWNFDLLGEYYFENLGQINAGVFYKAISNPVFNDNYQGTYNGQQGVEFNTPVNGKDAWLAGVSLGINRKFDFLPSFWKNFGTQLNATFMDSEMVKPSGRKIAIPYQANTLFNAQLFYEKEKLSTRLAFNHKGSYAIAFGERNIDDIYYGKYNTLDFSASYKITKNWTLFTDVNNILNNPLIYHYGKTQDRPRQVEYYGVKGNLGVKFSM